MAFKDDAATGWREQVMAEFVILLGLDEGPDGDGIFEIKIREIELLCAEQSEALLVV